jgi:DNA polymerase-3 subunit epsilon
MPARAWRREAALEARRLLAERPVYLDTETTGLEVGDQIVEICLLDHDGAVLVDSLVRPTCPVAPAAAAVHGITERLLQSAPAWPEVWRDVEARLGRRPVAIYNAPFDVRMIEQSHRAHGLSGRPPSLDARCLMELYARFRGDWNERHAAYRWHRLETAAWQCGLGTPQEHRARADALLARTLLHHVAAQAGAE